MLPTVTFSNPAFLRQTRIRMDAFEETLFAFSDLSIKIASHQDCAVIERDVPDFDDQSQKIYQTVQNIIQVGQVEKLKVEECKIYLRKHRLRLSGTKKTLIQRIKEHIDIVNGGGQNKYPTSSFVVNCKGDACMGDIVMFEQNVYEEFNIASRSAKGPPCGTRVVAGHIVKESYGAAKQQHTFTIEVLWSKGEKPLPPLHQLLIKGRNLYRLKTMRQRWDDEEERQKILSEKHDRGGVARLNREVRIQQREMQKIHKQARTARNERQNQKQNKRDMVYSVSIEPEKLVDQSKLQQQDPRNAKQQQNSDKTGKNVPIQPEDLQEKSCSISMAQIPTEWLSQRQPLISVNPQFGRDQHTNVQFQYADHRHPGYSQHYHKAYKIAKNLPVHQHGYKQKQTCRHYVQGRCFYGDRCRNLHEVAGNIV